MGLLDRFKKSAGKAKDLAEDNADKVADGVDNATDVADEKTGGEYTDHVDKVDEKAEEFAEDQDDA